MAKFRPVPSLSPEEFVGGAANASSAEKTAPLALVTPATPTVEQSKPALSTSSSLPSAEAETSGDDELVSITIRIKRRHHDRLMKLAAAEERSLAQVARRLLEPIIDSQ
jgi:hypothetical protein